MCTHLTSYLYNKLIIFDNLVEASSRLLQILPTSILCMACVYIQSKQVYQWKSWVTSRTFFKVIHLASWEQEATLKSSQQIVYSYFVRQLANYSPQLAKARINKYFNKKYYVEQAKWRFFIINTLPHIKFSVIFLVKCCAKFEYDQML